MAASTRPSSYEEAVAQHEWHVPERYNIAEDVCFKHPADKLAMIHEDFEGDRARGRAGASCRRTSQPVRQRAARARRRARRPRGDAAAADARDRVGVLRHLPLRGDPALDVRALRRRRHPPPRHGLRGEGARHRRGQPGPRRPVAGRARAAARRRAARDGAPPTSTASTRRRRPGAAVLLLRHDRPGQGDRACAPLPARARGVRLLPRRPGRRGLPRHGRVGVGGRDRAAAGPVALRRRPVRLPAQGRLRRPQAARLARPPRGHERVHHPDRDALDDVDLRRRAALPAEVPHRVLRGRAAEPGGDPLVPRAVRR